MNSIQNFGASSAKTHFPLFTAPRFVSPFTIACLLLIEQFCTSVQNAVHFPLLNDLLHSFGLDQPHEPTWQQLLTQIKQWPKSGNALACELYEKVLSIDNIGSFVDIIEIARNLLTAKAPEIAEGSISILPQSILGYWVRQFWIDFNSRPFSQLCTLFTEFQLYLNNSNAIPRNPRHVSLFLDKKIENLEEAETLDLESVKALTSLTHEFSTLPKSYYALALHAAQHRDLGYALDSLHEFTSRARHDLRMLIEPRSTDQSTKKSSNRYTARMYCWGALAFGQIYAKLNCTEQANWLLKCAYDQAQLYQDQACLAQAKDWLDFVKNRDKVNRPPHFLSASVLQLAARFILKTESTPVDIDALCLLARMKWSSGQINDAISIISSSLEPEAVSLLFSMRLELCIRQCDWVQFEALTVSLFPPYTDSLLYLLVQAKLRRWRTQEAFSLLDAENLPHDERWYAWRIECFMQINDHDKALLYVHQITKPKTFSSSDSLIYHFQCARIHQALEKPVDWSEFLLPILNEPDVWLRAWLGAYFLQYEFYVPLFQQLLALDTNDVVIRYKLYRLAKKHKLNIPMPDYESIKEKAILKEWM